MAELDFSAQIAELRSTFSSIRAVLDVDALTARVATLSEQAGAPDLWDDTARPQKETSELHHAQSTLAKLTAIQSRLDDLEVLVELVNGETDDEIAAEVAEEAQAGAARPRTRARGARGAEAPERGG